MAATSTKFCEDGTTELTFADGVIARTPSAILYDSLGRPLLTGQLATGNPFPADGALNVLLGVQQSGGNLALIEAPSFVGVTGAGLNWEIPTVPYLYYPNALDAQRTPASFIDLPSTAIVAGTPAAAWTPAAGKKFRLMGFALSLSVAGSIILKYAAANTVLFRTPALAAAGVFVAPAMGNGVMPGAANDVLKVDVTANGNVAGYFFGTEE